MNELTNERPVPQDVVRLGGRDLGRWPVFHMLFLLLAAVVCANALIALGTVNFKVNREKALVADAPVTRFIPLDPDKPRFVPQPLAVKAVVVIAHGFAGSQQLMWPFASSFARNGYAAVTFDWPGHGANDTPFVQSDQAALQRTLAAVVADTRQRWPGVPVVLLGHSLGSAAVVAYARTDPQIAATIAVSLIADANGVANLLVVDGAAETARIRAVGIAALPPGGVAEQQSGAFADGTARRVVFVPRSEHLSVLWHSRSFEEAVAWVDGVTATPRTAAITTDIRMPAIALQVVGVVWFWWSLGYFLFPRRAAPWQGSGLGWQRVVPLTLAAAVLTPLLLRVVPTNLIPIAVGSYVALHFAVYGVILLVGLTLVRAAPWPALGRAPWGRSVLAMLILVSVVVIGLGTVTQGWWLNLWPPARRLPWIIAIWLLLLPFFIADGWLLSQPQAKRALGMWTWARLVFIGSLLLATVVNKSLGFIFLILPVIVVAFALFGLMGARITRRTGSPWAAALAQAALLAWLMGVGFPLLG